MIRPQFRVSVARTCFPFPTLIMARSQVGVVVAEEEESPERVVVVASARRINSLHSDSEKRLSMTAAKRFLYPGRGGSVAVKSILRE